MRAAMPMLLCLCLTAVFPALAAPASLHPADGTCKSAVSQWRGETGERPRELLSKEPEYKSARPLYSALELGDAKDRFITLVVDESKGSGSGYDTLYVDANNNGDLTDDPVRRLKTEKNQWQTTMTSEPFAVTVKYHDGATRQLTVSVTLEMYNYGGVDTDNADLSVNCSALQHVEGLVQFGGDAVLVGLYDAADGQVPMNGCFDDFGVDRMRLDLNGDGKLDDEDKEFPLSRVIVRDGALWQIETNSAATAVTAQPFTAASGRLLLGFNLAPGAKVVSSRVELASHNGYAFACDLSAAEPFRAPVADYRITSGWMAVADDAGKEWRADFTYPKRIRIATDATAEIRLGMPLELEPVVRGTMKQGGYLQVSHRLVGASAEEYSSISPANRTTAPTVKIVDTEGIDVAEGKMEYG